MKKVTILGYINNNLDSISILTNEKIRNTTKRKGCADSKKFIFLPKKEREVLQSIFGKINIIEYCVENI